MLFPFSLGHFYVPYIMYASFPIGGYLLIFPIVKKFIQLHLMCIGRIYLSGLILVSSKILF